MIHLLLHGHWPMWYRVYVGNTTYFVYRCAICEPNHPNAVKARRKKNQEFYPEDYENFDC